MLRVAGRVITIGRWRTRRAALYEADLHKAFEFVRFKQTKPRRYFKALCQLLYCYLVYYALNTYQMTAEQTEIAYKGFIFAFFCLFHAEVKIGISSDTDGRKETINNDLSSGYTEWFHIPWPLFFFIPLVTWFRVSPATATVGTAAGCFVIFGLLKIVI